MGVAVGVAVGVEAERGAIERTKVGHTANLPVLPVLPVFPVVRQCTCSMHVFTSRRIRLVNHIVYTSIILYYNYYNI